MAGQWNNDCGTVKERYGKSGTMILEQWNSDDGRVEQTWWNSGMEMVEE